ncbi:tetratricopeptide repeat protein [Pseudorhizobium flavum]|uniref:tetratricopeptide repeat protein n=1 Tax=Pseudorhizobium flavum TaxID=1335061 RepID=UPI00376FA2DC
MQGKVKELLARIVEHSRKFRASKPRERGLDGRIVLAARLSPSVRRLLEIAEFYFESGDLENAARAVKRAEELPGSEQAFDLWFLNGLIKARQIDLDGAVASIRKAHSILPDNPHAVYCLGSLLACTGELTEADMLFARNVPVLTGAGTPTYTCALRFFPENVDGSINRVLSSVVEPNEKHNAAVYLVATDSVYLGRYGGALAESVRRNCGENWLLHYHVVNPDETAYRTIQAISEAHKNIRVTVEEADLSEYDDAEKKVYYSCARYLVLEDCLRMQKCPIVVADIDQMVMADPSPLMETLGDRDVAVLRFSDQANNLFSYLSATLMVVSPTAKGHQFSRALRLSTELALVDKAKRTWHLDQAILAVTYLKASDTAYADISPTMIHLGVGEPPVEREPAVGVFWSITNSLEENLQKLNLPSFLSLMR